MIQPCVYCLTHSSKPDYFYIGGTLSGYKRRFSNHLQQLNNNTHGNRFLQNVHNKYGGEGWNIFELEVFPEGVDKDLVFQSEFKYISEYINRGANLYNSIIVPSNTYPNKSARASISEQMKERNPMKNSKSVEKMQKSRSRNRQINNKTVYVFNSKLELVFSAKTAKEVAEFVKTDSGNISRALSSKRPILGYLISYDAKEKFECIDRRKIDRKRLKIISVNPNFSNERMEYKSIAEASRFCGVCESGVIRALNGEAKSCANLIWVYKDDKLEEVILQKIEKLKTRPTVSIENRKKTSEYHSIPILQICPKTGAVVNKFSSIKEAGKSIKVDASCISRCLNGKTKTSAGFIFKHASLW